MTDDETRENETPTQPGPGPGPGSVWEPPPSAWQPPPPTGWQPPPASWQPTQPGWQPPAWEQQAYPPRSWTGSPQYGTSGLAVIGAVALLIIGGLLTVISALVIAVGAGGTALLEEIDPSLIGLGGAIATAIVVVFGILLVFGILHIVAAIGVFVHKSWARWTGVVLAVLGLMLGLLMLLGSTNAPTATSGDLIVVIVWLVAYGAALIGLVAGGEHFQPRYPGR